MVFTSKHKGSCFGGEETEEGSRLKQGELKFNIGNITTTIIKKENKKAIPAYCV